MNHIPHRFFWTWDHSTNWCLHVYGAQNSGVANHYAKAPEIFEKDYMRCVDFCAEHKIDAIGIVGLIRDAHGGVESVRRLCNYANERGVRIYMIAGLFAYGGVYYQGDHKYSLNKFFEKNPELIGETPEGEPLIVQFKGKHGYRREPQGCPSSPILHEYVLESLDWLFREIPELGGIQMESGDSGVCQCAKCRARRGAGTGYISVADMAGIYPEASETIRRVSPDALIICETYSHFLDDACKFFDDPNPSEDLKKLLAMPESTFWQWKCDQRLIDGDWTVDDKMLKSMRKFNHVMRAHSGTQWRGGRASFAVDKIRRQCLLSYESGLTGVSMFGELAPFHANSEFNYLAMEYFADHPHASNDDYVRDVMAPRLGGKQFADYYFEVAGMHRDVENIPAVAANIAKITSELTDYEHLRRWQYLASFLNGYYWEIAVNGGAERIKDSDRIGEWEN